MMQVYEKDLKEYSQYSLLYANDVYELMKEFHEDLAKEFCMENDSREDEIFEMAKEHGKLVEKECEHKFDVCIQILW